MADFSNGYVHTATAFNQLVAQQDGFSVAPPSEITTVPVTNIAYAQQGIAGQGGSTVSVLSATCSTAAATAKVHVDLSDLILRSTPGKGVAVTGAMLFYTVSGAALAGQPALSAVVQAFATPGATAQAPTATAVGGAVTTTPATLPTAVPTAGQFYTVSFSFAAPIALTSPLQRAYLELTVPLAVGGTVSIAGLTVTFTNNPL